MTAVRRRVPPRPRPKGSVAVTFSIMLPVMLGFVGLAIDLSMVYARSAELQHLADATAMAAAHELDGTLAGVTRARDKATAVALGNYYQIKNQFSDGSSWSTAALSFSDTPTGVWRAASAITSDAAAAALVYARVDTTALQGLSAAPGHWETTFLRAVGAGATFDAATVAVAGRVGMQVTPLAVCALSNTRLDRRPPVTGPELVEFGYRRGITYNLLNLNPSGAAPQKFLLDPIADGAAVGASGTHFNEMKPFFCSGSVAYGTLRANGPVRLQAIGPLFGGADWLNSRFDGNACTRNGAPPDDNVTVFDNYDWMDWQVAKQHSAKSVLATVGGVTMLKTVADFSLAEQGGVAADDFGPLWIYSKPVQYVDGKASGADEPEPTYFATSDWPQLYPDSAGSSPSQSGYLSTPYLTQYQPASSGRVYAERRVLNLALLDCSAGTVGAIGTVLGFGRFFMTQPATATTVYGEFAGLINANKLATQVALHK